MQCMVVEDAVTQNIWQTPPSQQASRLVEHNQIAKPGGRVENVAARHQSSVTCLTFTTIGHASVDEQLHEWDAFWRFSSDTDPFCGDWTPR